MRIKREVDVREPCTSEQSFERIHELQLGADYALCRCQLLGDIDIRCESPIGSDGKDSM